MIRKILYLSLVMILFLPFSQTMAITTQQLQSIYGDSEYYVPGIAGGVCGSSASAVTLTGGDNVQQAYNFYVQEGLSAEASASIVGNFEQESGVNPNSTNSIGAHGIAQWLGSRLTKLIDYAQNNNEDENSLATQLAFSWQELNDSYPTVLQTLKTTTGSTTYVIDTDTANVFNVYENPGDNSLPSREGYATQILNEYGSSSGNSGSSVASSSSPCVSASNCTSTTTTSVPSTGSSANVSSIRQNVVCLAEQELALWESQPNYNSPYPDFTYAATGFLKYTDNSYEVWCADFVSWIYNQAGYPFSGGDDGGWRLDAVSAIQQLGVSPNSGFTWHPESSGYVPQPGDLALHYDPTQSAPWYHVNIFISSSGGVSEYIGGDQGGVDEPDGTYGTETPVSGSIVSIDTGSGYYDNQIVGYISPN